MNEMTQRFVMPRPALSIATAAMLLACSPSSPIEGLEVVETFAQGEQLNCDDDAEHFVRYRATRDVTIDEDQLRSLFGWNGSTNLFFPKGATNRFAGQVRMEDGSMRGFGHLCNGNLFAEGGGGLKIVGDGFKLFEGQIFVAPRID